MSRIWKIAETPAREIARKILLKAVRDDFCGSWDFTKESVYNTWHSCTKPTEMKLLESLGNAIERGLR